MVNLRYLKQFFHISISKWKVCVTMRLTSGGRLHVQAEYERWLFFSFTASVIKELCSVFMVRESLRVSLFIFRLRTSSRVFTKLLKTPMSAVRMRNIRIVMHLDDMFIMGQIMEGVLMFRDTVISLQRNLDFVLNLEKSILNPGHKLEFFEITINSLKMCLSLP